MVRSGGNGTVSVAIDLDGEPCADDTVVLFGIDANRRQYLVVLRSASAGFARWDGTCWSAFPHCALEPRLEGTQVRFSLALADIGASSFDYWLAAARDGGMDAVPTRGRFIVP